MRLIVLGSGTLVPDASRASAGIAVVEGEEAWVFDLGRGVLGRMAEAGIDPLALRHLHFTHWHPDHSCDLVPFLFARNYAQRPPTNPLLLTGPPGFAAFVGRLAEPWPWLTPRFPCDLRELSDETLQAGPARLEAIRLVHGEMPNVGYRLSRGDRTLAYTGDTGPCPQLLSLARGVDILVSECSLPDELANETHLSPRSLGAAAREAGCRTLVVTHLYPELDPAVALAGLRREFEGEIVMAEDGWARDV